MRVAIAGKKGVGKSFVSSILRNEYGFCIESLAAPLKQACRDVFQFTDTQVNGAHEKEQVDMYWGVTPREVMQIVGTELFRKELSVHLPQLHDIWIRALLRRLRKNAHSNVVVDDVRFDEEVEALKAAGFIVIKVTRGFDSARETGQQHVSEQGVSKCDYTFINNAKNPKECMNDFKRFFEMVLQSL